MEYLEQVHAFAQKWMNKFRNQKIDYVGWWIIAWQMTVKLLDFKWIAEILFLNSMEMRCMTIKSWIILSMK